jgi:aspartate/methionine/tyrosine aminotransferase
MQMAITRGGDPSKNFAVGEPWLLGEHFEPLVQREVLTDMSYPPLRGRQGLIDAISNTRWQHGKHIVIANGAKQALAAAFYALKAKGINVMHVPPPYWPSFPTLIKAAGMEWDDRPSDSARWCVASPNNPDGWQFEGPGRVEVWDAAYASPAYGWNGMKPKAHCTVHSASKLLGLSGLRVGWLSTDDEDLAERAGYFVEITTSGVSNLSQAHVAAILKNFPELRDAHAKMQTRLIANGTAFFETIAQYCSASKAPPSSGGMFAWFQPREHHKFQAIAAQLGVSYVDGVNCGRPYHVRMTLGNPEKVTRGTFEAIARGLA